MQKKHRMGIANHWERKYARLGWWHKLIQNTHDVKGIPLFTESAFYYVKWQDSNQLYCKNNRGFIQTISFQEILISIFICHDICDYLSSPFSDTVAG